MKNKFSLTSNELVLNFNPMSPYNYLQLISVNPPTVQPSNQGKRSPGRKWWRAMVLMGIVRSSNRQDSALTRRWLPRRRRVRRQHFWSTKVSSYLAKFSLVEIHTIQFKVDLFKEVSKITNKSQQVKILPKESSNTASSTAKAPRCDENESTAVPFYTASVIASPVTVLQPKEEKGIAICPQHRERKGSPMSPSFSRGSF